MESVLEAMVDFMREEAREDVIEGVEAGQFGCVVQVGEESGGV